MASGQLGFYTLPKDDFIWHWGKTSEEQRRGFADIEARGSEGGFQCELLAALRPSNNLSTSEVRDIEEGLRIRMDFIYAVSDAMNYFDRSLSLDWATLDCKKLQPGPVDEAARAERESRARDKMLKEIERRRAQQRDPGR
jgi:hypothetical protein